MCRDCYELDLPEPTWSETLKESPEMLALAGIAIVVPASLLALSYVLIKFANKKLETL